MFRDESGFTLIDGMVATAIFAVAAILVISSITTARLYREDNLRSFEDFIGIEKEIFELYQEGDWESREGDEVAVSEETTILIDDYEYLETVEALHLEVSFRGSEYGFPLSREVEEITPDGEAAITGYDYSQNTYHPEVEIPTVITVDNGWSDCGVFEIDTVLTGDAVVEIVEIANNAFADEGLTVVQMADSIKTIGNWSFANNNLTELIFPDSVEEIRDAAFEENELIEVEIGDDVDVASCAIRDDFANEYEWEQGGTYIWDNGWEIQ